MGNENKTSKSDKNLSKTLENSNSISSMIKEFFDILKISLKTKYGISASDSWIILLPAIATIFTSLISLLPSSNNHKIIYYMVMIVITLFFIVIPIFFEFMKLYRNKYYSQIIEIEREIVIGSLLDDRLEIYQEHFSHLSGHTQERTCKEGDQIINIVTDFHYELHSDKVDKFTVMLNIMADNILKGVKYEFLVSDNLGGVNREDIKKVVTCLKELIDEKAYNDHTKYTNFDNKTCKISKSTKELLDGGGTNLINDRVTFKLVKDGIISYNFFIFHRLGISETDNLGLFFDKKEEKKGGIELSTFYTVLLNSDSILTEKLNNLYDRLHAICETIPEVRFLEEEKNG